MSTALWVLAGLCLGAAFGTVLTFVVIAGLWLTNETVLRLLEWAQRWRRR